MTGLLKGKIALVTGAGHGIGRGHALELAKHGAGAPTFSDWWEYKLGAYDAIPYNAAILHQKGVLTSLNSDIPWLQSFMVYEFIKPVKYGGVSKEEALRMLTLYPAKQLRIAATTRSISAWSRTPARQVANSSEPRRAPRHPPPSARRTASSPRSASLSRWPTRTRSSSPAR